MSDETKVYYVGTSKVTKAEPVSEGWIHYETEDGRSGLVKDNQYKAMQREAAYSDELVIVFKWSPVSSQVLQILLDYDMPMSDSNFVMKQVQQSVIDNYEKAVSKLFGRGLTDHVRLSQIDKVLKSDTELIVE